MCQHAYCHIHNESRVYILSMNHIIFWSESYVPLVLIPFNKPLQVQHFNAFYLDLYNSLVHIVFVLLSVSSKYPNTFD